MIHAIVPFLPQQVNAKAEHGGENMKDSNEKTRVESLPYPTGIMKWVYRSPILLYRLGLGWLVGRLFMVMTTVGRKSGRLRRTAIEFHEFKGRKYIFSGWGTKTDWYRNIQANPCITIQTWRGAESVIARRVTSNDELAEAFELAMSNPTMRAVIRSVGFDLTLEQFLAQKERFTFVTFDPTDQPTPAPVEADLVWTWAITIPILLYIFLRLTWNVCAKSKCAE